MMLSGSTIVRYHGLHRAQATLGTAELPEFGRVEIGAGRFFSPIEAARNAPVVVNYALARELTPGREPLSIVGEAIQVQDRMRRVIGALSPNPFEERRSPDFVLRPDPERRAASLPPIEAIAHE